MFFKYSNIKCLDDKIYKDIFIIDEYINNISFFHTFNFF